MDEKFRKALECCIKSKCNVCPLFPELYCDEMLAAEVENYIAELEERIAIMQADMDTYNAEELDFSGLQEGRSGNESDD